MIKDWFRKNVAAVLYEDKRTLSVLERVIADANAVGMVVQIDNGYLLSVFRNGSLSSQLKYCKDAEDIAKAIVTQAVKNKLKIGVPPQLDLATPKVNTVGGVIGIGSSGGLGVGTTTSSIYRSPSK